MTLRVHILLATVLPALAAGAGTRADVAAVAARDAVAIVNGRPIDRAEFALCLVRSLGRSAIQSFSDRALIEQEAARLGLTLTDEEFARRKQLAVAMQARAVLAETRMGQEEFQATAEAQGWHVSELHARIEASISDRSLRSQALVEKILAPSLAIDEADLRDHYERTRGRRYAAAHILVPTRARAEDVIDRLRGDMSLWTQFVIERSLDRDSLPYKGRLRPVLPSSLLGAALADMGPGDLKVLACGDYWQVVRLIREIAPSGESFEDVADAVRAEVLATRAAERGNYLLADLHSRAHVVANLSPDPNVRRLLGEETAVFVNGQALPVARLAEVLVEDYGADMIEPYIERVLIEQEAERMAVAVTDAELEARMTAIADGLLRDHAAAGGIDEEQLPEALARRGVDAADLRRDLLAKFVAPEDVRATLLAEKLVRDGVEVTRQDVVRAHRELGEPRATVKVLSARDVVTAEQMDRRLRRGVSFDLVARTQSPRSGVWMPGHLELTMSSSHPYYAQLRRLQTGETSGVFKHGGQYRIIKLLRRHPSVEPPPLETVYEELERRVRLLRSRDRVQALLVRLKAESDIQVLLN